MPPDGGRPCQVLVVASRPVTRGYIKARHDSETTAVYIKILKILPMSPHRVATVAIVTGKCKYFKK